MLDTHHRWYIPRRPVKGNDERDGQGKDAQLLERKQGGKGPEEVSDSKLRWQDAVQFFKQAPPVFGPVEVSGTMRDCLCPLFPTTNVVGAYLPLTSVSLSSESPHGMKFPFVTKTYTELVIARTSIVWATRPLECWGLSCLGQFAGLFVLVTCIILPHQSHPDAMCLTAIYCTTVISFYWTRMLV